MSRSRTSVERLDFLLARLEDEVLRSESKKKVPRERVATMRSEIESLIRTNADRVEELGSGQSAGVPAARTIMARAMARLGSWTGASPRVRMAFSGTQSEKSKKSKDSDTDQGDSVPGAERK